MSFSRAEFDLITGLPHDQMYVEPQNLNPRRLRSLYLDDKLDMKALELNQSFPRLNFQSDEDAVKMAIFYLIELAMMDREKKQQMDWKMLGIIDDWDFFCSYDWLSILPTLYTRLEIFT